MSNAYREPAPRVPEAPALPPGMYDYAAAVERWRQWGGRWWPIGVVVLLPYVGMLLYPLGLWVLAKDDLARNMGIVLSIWTYVITPMLFVRHRRARRNEKNFFTEKLARETEEFLAAQEEESLKTRVFLAPAGAEGGATVAGTEETAREELEAAPTERAFKAA